MRSKFENINVAGIILFSFLVNTALPASVEAHGSHPKGGKRLQQCGKADKQTKRVARHTTGAAVERFQLKELITQEDFDRASREMNHFLRWKLGGKVAVCGQYVSTGYGHFEKAYGDEAAAMMLGVLSFSRQDAELEIPDWMINYIEKYVGFTEPSLYGYFGKDLGLPEPLIFQLTNKIRRKLVDETLHVKVYIPKKFDVDNRLVEGSIVAKKTEAQGGGSPPSVLGKNKSLVNPRLGTFSTRTPNKGTGSSPGKGPIGKSPPIGGSGTGTSPDVCEDPYSSEDCYCQAFPEDCAGGGQYAEEDFKGTKDTSYDYFEERSDMESEESFEKRDSFDPFSSGSEQGPLQSDVPWYEKLGGTGQ